MVKNIVVLSDGTGQDGGKGHDSNVYKIYRMLEDRTDQQIVYYDQGLGTDLHRLGGNAFGMGFSKNIIDCYRFIFDYYNAGDRIFLLGFSRGAATVRSLASFIHFFGILPKARPKLIDEAYKLYRTGRKPIVLDDGMDTDDSTNAGMKRLAVRGQNMLHDTTYMVYSAFRKDLEDKANQFSLAHPHMWVKVEFLGVWDTVPALGVVPMAGLNLLLDRLPWTKHSFHDFLLHRSVRNAYQALAIDDNREWFRPTIWNQYDIESQKISQVWFSGSHTDVGGGYKEAGLSDIALEWMIYHAVSHGIRLYPDSRKRWNFCISPDGTDTYHPPRSGFGRVFKEGSRDKVWGSKAVKTFGPPVIHESVLQRARADRKYRPWILSNYKKAYPDPQKWLEENRGEYLRSRYKADLENRYQEWFTRQWQGGVQDIKGIEEWLVDNSLPFEQWLKESPEVERNWAEKNAHELEAFEGTMYLVDRKAMPELRDYDMNSLEKKLSEATLDQSAYANLLLRGLSNGRIEHDTKRWDEALKEKE